MPGADEFVDVVEITEEMQTAPAELAYEESQPWDAASAELAHEEAQAWDAAPELAYEEPQPWDAAPAELAYEESQAWDAAPAELTYEESQAWDAAPVEPAYAEQSDAGPLPSDTAPELAYSDVDDGAPPPSDQTPYVAPGSTIYVALGDSAEVIQDKLNAVEAGGSLVFPGNSTFDFGGATVVGKSDVTVLADGPVTIHNAPGAGSDGAFDFSADTNWTVRGRAPGEGFIFEGSLVNATGASDWEIGNNQFIGQLDNGYDGSAIRMNDASFGTIINNDFTNAGGTVVGMYNLDNITYDGNHFVDCWQPISVQEPTNGDTSLGNNLVVRNNVFLGTQRVPIEMGPSPEGAQHFSGLVIDNNHIDQSNNIADPGTLMGISLVGQAANNTTVTNNFIRRGEDDAGEVAVAIEMTGTGLVANNDIRNMGFAALTYQSGWEVSNNSVYNDGSSPDYGFANNGNGVGNFGHNPVMSEHPATPALPARSDW